MNPVVVVISAAFGQPCVASSRLVKAGAVLVDVMFLLYPLIMLKIELWVVLWSTPRRY